MKAIKKETKKAKTRQNGERKKIAKDSTKHYKKSAFYCFSFLITGNYNIDDKGKRHPKTKR